MRTQFWLAILVVLSGCSADRSLTVPDPQRLTEAFTAAPVVSSEPGFESIDRWVARPHQTRLELGLWMPDSPPTLLVTLDVTEASHAEGMIHHLVAVFDPFTHDRLTPVFHYVSDHAQRTILHGTDRQHLFYVGHAQGQRDYRRDTSTVVSFEREEVHAWRAVGQLDPEQYIVTYPYRGSDTLALSPRSHDSALTPLNAMTWNPDKGRFVSR